LRCKKRSEPKASILSSYDGYAFYLLSHTIVKLALVVGLLRNQLWSYPASLAVLTLFIIYQIYRFYDAQSLGLIVLTACLTCSLWSSSGMNTALCGVIT
jgi:uncharacterized membrane protein